MPTVPELVARDVAEALGADLSGPGAEGAEDLFVRFQARVPYAPSPEGEPPGRLLARFLEAGDGCAGDARTRAFVALAAALGQNLDLVRAESDREAFPVAVARIGGRAVLVDPGFPLPGVVPLEPPGEEYATGYGRLSVAAGPGTRRLLLDARGGTRELYRLAWPPEKEVPDARPGRRPPGPHERFRLQGDRFLRWKDGEMEVADVWSRLRWPLPGAEAGLLEAFFQVPAPDLAAIPASPHPPRLSVYDACSLPARELESRLSARPADPTTLPEGGAVSPILRKSWSFSPGPAGTRVKLTATLADVPPRGLTEAVRKTLVFHLVTELFELSRERTAGRQ